MNQKLTKIQAYNVVFRLFSMYYTDNQLNGIHHPHEFVASLVGSMAGDQLVWEIWEEAIEAILLEDGISTKGKFEYYEEITLWQAFRGVPKFLETYYTLDETCGELVVYIAEFKETIKNQSTDTPLWQKWIKCVERVSLIKEFHYRIQLDEFDEIDRIVF